MLAHVHARGFVHRDVKPANILLDHGREPRLADFGIARALDGTVATATGAVAGTAAYLAPEQVRGETVGPPADVYALGLVLIEARTGRREYPGAMVESATARLYRRPAVPEGLPPDLAALLSAMTHPDPAARPNAADVAAALTKRPRVPRRPVGHALAAAGLLALVLGGISLFTNAPDPTPAPVGAVAPVQMGPHGRLGSLTPPTLHRGTETDARGGSDGIDGLVRSRPDPGAALGPHPVAARLPGRVTRHPCDGNPAPSR